MKVRLQNKLPLEPFMTIPKAAKLLGLPVSTLRRAVNEGLVPYHRPFGERIRVRISEVNLAIEARQIGGWDDE